jgi:hypothetical protein
MHLTGLDRDVDVVVGHQVAEALGDAAQFESQRNLLTSAPMRRFTGQLEPPHGREEISRPGGGRNLTE